MAAYIVDGIWPVYRDEAEHITDGELPAVDLAKAYGIPWIAPFTCNVVSGTGSDPERNDGKFHAGYVTVLQGIFNGQAYRLHYCHGQSNEVKIGQLIQEGAVFGHVGFSGTCIPPGPLGAHLHFWVEVYTSVGWDRVTEVKAFLASLQENGMTQEQKDEIARIAGIFENWERVLKERQLQAESVGYGVDDSFSKRLADELGGAAAGLRGPIFQQ